MMKWWKKLFSRTEQSTARDQDAGPIGRTAPWVEADSPENPFGVPMVNLMQNLKLMSASQKKSVGANAVSWRPNQQDRLAIEKNGPGIACDLRYPIGSYLPDGMLFIPAAMEDKWVIAKRDGAVIFARSWSGETIVTADASVEGNQLCLDCLYAHSNILELFGDLVTVIDWIMRSHALEERLALPVVQEVAETLHSRPLVAMNVFGHRLFCAGVGYSMPQPSGLLYSDGEVAAAVYNNDVKAIRTLASDEAWQTSTRQEGSPPFVLASLLGHTGLCRVMLELGAGVNVTDNSGGNALQAGIVGRHGTGHAGMLLDAGARPDDANKDGFTSMHAAAEVDDAAMVRFLAERGANLEAQTNLGYSPLHIAAGLGHQAAAQALVECGANMDALGNGHTAEQIARNEGNDELARWFKSLS